MPRNFSASHLASIHYPPWISHVGQPFKIKDVKWDKKWQKTLNWVKRVQMSKQCQKWNSLIQLLRIHLACQMTV
jgi:hypothetical protein